MKLCLLVIFALTIGDIVSVEYDVKLEIANETCRGKRPAKSEVKFLVLHHTAGNLAGSLQTLKTCPTTTVSAHYLVPKAAEKAKWTVYQLVNESEVAYHAGKSSWQNVTSINAESIGIEIVHVEEDDEYPAEQIDIVISLVKGIINRHNIIATRIIGHADIAPGRKSSDPGREFPWKTLYDNGIGMWPNKTDVNSTEQRKSNLKCAQTKLGFIGYEIGADGKMGPQTRSVLLVFQKHFDLEETQTLNGHTASVIEALVKRYFPAKVNDCKMFP